MDEVQTMRITMEDVYVEPPKEWQGEEQDTEAKGTFCQKIGYFWDYHKWKVIVPVILSVFALSAIVSYRRENRELTLYIAVMNAKMDSPEDADFGERYAADRGIDTQKLPVRTETNLYHPKSEAEASDETSAAGIQKYQALLTSGNVDLTITTDWVIDEYEKSGCYLNLRDVLPSQLYASLDGKLYYAADPNGHQIPVGIYVDQTETMQEFYKEEKPIAVISAFSKRIDASVDFIEWLLTN